MTFVVKHTFVKVDYIQTKFVQILVKFTQTLLGYLNTWSVVEADKTAIFPILGLHHFGKFREPIDK